MYGADGPDTFWLNFTNFALGLVTLACVLAIAAGVVHELADRRRKRAARERPAEDDDHAFVTPELGLTMADGGSRIDRAKPAAPQGR
jgi:hypothetical protein